MINSNYLNRFGYEKASERWLPIHTVETILVSVISMLAGKNCFVANILEWMIIIWIDPNDESPANVDAAKEWRENFQEFR